MTVEVQMMQGGIRGHGPLNFADTFTAGAPARFLGPNWSQIISSDDSSTGVVIDAQLNSGITGVQFGNGSGSIDNGIRTVMIPTFLDNNAVRNLSSTRGLFVQWQFVSRAVGGANSACGIILMSDPNNNRAGYYARFDSADAGNFEGISRDNGLGGTVLFGNGAAYVANDIFRLEAIPTAGLTGVVLNYIKNGSLVATFTDNSGSRITSGLYGMMFLGAAAASQMVFKNFSGGVL